jgi:hypothetical protein
LCHLIQARKNPSKMVHSLGSNRTESLYVGG